MKNYMNEYRMRVEKINCPTCGKLIKPTSMTNHRKSKNHNKIMSVKSEKIDFKKSGIT